MSIPKYSKLENERRWLMPRSFANSLRPLPHKKISDLYLSCGRLRLRSIIDSQNHKVEFKLCKKYGSISPMAQPIVNMYLTAEEHAAISVLPGHKLSKCRYKKIMNDIEYSFDVFEGALTGLVICEVEAESESDLTQIADPDFAIKEVTGDSVYNGGFLCKMNQAESDKLLINDTE